MIALNDKSCIIIVLIVYACGFSHNQIIIVDLMHDTCFNIHIHSHIHIHIIPTIVV